METTRRGGELDTVSTVAERAMRITWRERLAHLTRFDRVLLTIIAVYTAALIVMAFRMSPGRFTRVFSEVGPFEEISIALWLAASAVVLWRIRPFTYRSYAFSVLYLAFAAREANFHKAFTSDSLLKINYYLKTPAPLAEKLCAGIVAATLIGVLFYVIFVAARFLLVRHGYRTRAGFWLMAAGVLFVLTKAFDRAPAVIYHLTDDHLQIDLLRLMKALEEGLEAFAPLLFIVSAWISQNERRYLS
jgi:hypothetical protein